TEPTTDGLTSTSLLEFAIMSHLEAMNSHEQTSPETAEPDLIPGSLHAAPGSGFASEENEESKILQPPQYFWEDGGELNESSLDLGPATATVQTPAEFVEPDLHTPFSSTLEEEEGLLPIDHSRGGLESLQTSEPEVTSSEPVDQEESLSALLFSTASARPDVVTEAAIGGQEEDSVSPGLDLGSSMGPGLLPVSSVFSTTPAQSPGVSEEQFEVTTGDMWAAEGVDSEQTVTTTSAELSEPTVEAGGEEHSARDEFLETTVGWEMLEPTVLTELEQTAEMPVGTLPPGGSSADTQTPSGGEQHPASSAASWDRADDLLCTLYFQQESYICSANPAVFVLSFQVICKDWSNLAGKNYIILNMSDNIDCVSITSLAESAVVSGTLPFQSCTTSFLASFQIGIQNYSTTTSCQSHPNQTRSDYGKLFVVLVIIGSICAIIIVLGLIYNCWQRRLPKMKNMSHGEELRFVENGCHDNPTLDVASDSQSEMQEKKPSVNGGNTINGPDSWDVLINKQASEDVDVFEEDTHL
uniref:Podocalyxin like 2 n=1 Tax=Pavo cristatus TaxID=9049 RepID=A0A8C9FP27_PAVCR